ncbi:uncharacterized protein ATNIH1004_000825 [Aspergillus tanneri]|uniref:Enoyl-CoA hydratase n=1 Tax=Aspergillus tanneri TaxID=1220188 RepID=A0A5M9N0Z4_9EURO|nr:uncharacterized protein ATNIH1004_000825 [Aspergillus tanneri]KAA8651926.1 hypothetical protein ATNIH1004_000825 [Aspergillus tanneri]
MQKSPENRLDQQFCQEIIRAFNSICETLGPNSEGAVITRGQDSKFFCTVYIPYYKYFGHNVTPHDSRLPPSHHRPRNRPHLWGRLSTRLCARLPHHELAARIHVHAACGPGMYFPGVGVLPRLKLHPQVARKVLLEGHRFSGKEALQDGLVDAIAEPEDMLLVAVELARKWAPKAKAGVYGLLGSELRGEMSRSLQQISYVHSRSTFSPGISKI